MSNRYTKIKSNYTMRTKHQDTDIGTIMERDWVTTNGLNVLRFGTGRRVWYNSGNFVFTTSNIPSYHKRHKLSNETKEWSWQDCKDADGTVNEVKPSNKTNDIRCFAYYGSCSELIRATVEEIILDFPGRLYRSHTTLTDVETGNTYYELQNDFNIDLHHPNVRLDEYDNEFRFFSESWEKYCIVKNGDIENAERVIEFTILYNNVSDCIRDDDGKVKIHIQLKTKEDTYDIYGYVRNLESNKNIYSEIVYCVDYELYKDYKEFSIQPCQEYIDDYFSKLSGFKGLLLRQDTKPLYSNEFKTPVEHNFEWFYPEIKYTWPSNGYCIDVSSLGFEMFYSSLIEIGIKMDELWTDNIYRSMTHESIKNFDWTYTRTYEDGEENDNIEGGERMIKILRLIGRVFDDVKNYIDGIKSTKNITYDNFNNCPDALMSDEAELKGVDVISTIGSEYDINQVITADFLKIPKYVQKDVSWIDMPRLSTHYKWYQTKNSTDIYPDVCDNEIMRRFVLSFKRVMQTKGTQQAIDMLMSFFGFCRNPIAPSDKDDYSLEEEAFYTKKMIPYYECVDGTNEEGVVSGDDWTKDEHIKWNNLISTKKGALIEEVNSNKDLELLYYPDGYSGIPLATILLGHKNEPFIVPYYNPYLIYDGNLIFQGKGGWGKFVKKYDDEPIDDCFDYSETLSYLHVVGTIDELLSINPITLNEYDIYYVVNLNKYTEYDENPPIGDSITISHYFVLTNSSNPEYFKSWKNIPIKPLYNDGSIEKVEQSVFEEYYDHDEWYYDIDTLIKDKEEGYKPTDDDKKSVYTYTFKHLEYLESIMSTTVGNNPHTGYGNYDDGSEFLEYMEKPFKYSIDRKLFNSLDYENLAEIVRFDDIRKNRVTDKIQIICDTKDDKDNIVKHKNENLDDNDIFNLWYINTKVLTITNNIKQRVMVTDEEGIKDADIDGIKYNYNKGDFVETDLYERLTDEDKEKCETPKYYFNKYFKQVILPYLMQVIPSTTILKIKGF